MWLSTIIYFLPSACQIATFSLLILFYAKLVHRHYWRGSTTLLPAGCRFVLRWRVLCCVADGWMDGCGVFGLILWCVAQKGLFVAFCVFANTAMYESVAPFSLLLLLLFHYRALFCSGAGRILLTFIFAALLDWYHPRSHCIAAQLSSVQFSTV